MRPLLIALAVVLAGADAHVVAQDVAPVTAPEVIVQIRIHGNHTTPDDEVRRLCGIEEGQTFTPDLMAGVTTRLESSGRFRDVRVLKRFASIEDPAPIVLVILVTERLGVSTETPTPGLVRQLASRVMWSPILAFDDGYGFTYGARVSVVDLLGERTRVSTPLTWGGERRAAIEWERTFEGGPVTRIVATSGIRQRENPAYDADDRRGAVTARLERAFTATLKIGARASSESVRFASIRDRVTTAGVDLTLDTRRDPAFPRNAIHASLGWDRQWFEQPVGVTRVRADVRGYLGLIGQSVLAVRAQQEWSNAPLPPFERLLLGGTASLRGRRLGYRTGDNFGAASAEVRVPLSSPLRLARVGLAAFVDTGAAYDYGNRLRDARFDTSVGAGVFVGAPVLNARLDVARALGHDTRIVFTLGVVF